MFQDLTSRLDSIFRRLKGRGKLTAENIAETLREVRRVLLEADVNFKVVKEFIANIEKKAVGEEVVKSIMPGQQVIKIIHDELAVLLGGADAPLREANLPPTVIMVVGLQGSGKTTLCGKLAKHLIGRGRRPLLVAADLQRPAAVDQLQVVGKSAGAAVLAPQPPLRHLEKIWKRGGDFNSDDMMRGGARRDATPVDICKASINEARQHAFDTVILDTAGRLHVNEELMNELRAIKVATDPHEILFVADGMTGQDAVNAAQAFAAHVDFTGIVLTKMDGDARGGAALSIKHVTGRPIKFISTGEKLEALEKFHPQRMAGRILGMGDVVSLVEKAQEAVDAEKARALEKKLRQSSFSLEDFYDQLQHVKKMGPLQQLVGMLPGMNNKAMGNVDVDEKALVRTEAIIQSMTIEERQRPQILNGSRRLRIAKGSGTSVQEVNRLLKQFSMMQKLIKHAPRGGLRRGSPFGF